VSKRHQNNRRKAYGRRQHEVHERRQRDVSPESMDLGMDETTLDGGDRYSFLDPRAARLQYAMGE
jgi:hypothetical protein